LTYNDEGRPVRYLVKIESEIESNMDEIGVRGSAKRALENKGHEIISPIEVEAHSDEDQNDKD
jgi:hypothetical protein